MMTRLISQNVKILFHEVVHAVFNVIYINFIIEQESYDHVDQLNSYCNIAWIFIQDVTTN